MDRRNHIEYTIDEQAEIEDNHEIFNRQLNILLRKKKVSIYDNQDAIAYNVVGALKNRKIINVMVIAETQSGKTGSMLATIRLYLQDKSNMIPIENIYIITGVSSREWIEQTKERMPTCLQDRIFHRNQLLTIFANDIKNKKNILIIMDEVQVAALKGQTLNKTMDIAEFNKHNLYENDIKIIEYTATPDGTIYDLMKWDDASYKLLAPSGEGYVSSFELLHDGRVKQYKDLCGYCKEKDDDEQDYTQIMENIQEIKNDVCKQFSHPMYHIIRTNKGYAQNITINNFDSMFNFSTGEYLYVTYDGESDIYDINSMLEKKPKKHTFIFIKEKLRCAKTLHKKYIGILYERYTISHDDAAIIQGLIGRDTGYDNNGTSICYTNIDTIERYRKMWISNFDDNSIQWSSKTTKYRNGILSAKETFNNPSLYDSRSETSSNDSIESVSNEKPYIFKSNTCDFKEIKDWFKEHPLYGKGPHAKKKDDNGFIKCMTQFDKVEKIRCLEEFEEYEANNKWGIRGKSEQSKKKNKYRVYPVYRDSNDVESLQWWLVYYNL